MRVYGRMLRGTYFTNGAPYNTALYTQKNKGAFEGAEGAIQTFSSLPTVGAITTNMIS